MVGLLLSVISILIYVAILAALVYLLEWGLGKIFPDYPRKVMQIVWVIVVLIAFYMIIAWMLGGFDPTLPAFRGDLRR